jgi:predicted neuraminidase
MRIVLFTCCILAAVFPGCNNYGVNQVSTGNDTLILEHIFPYQDKHCHGSSLTAFPGGDLIAVWFHGSGERTADDVAIMGSRYDVRKRIWSEPFVMADVPGFPDINPVVFIDPNKKLWLVWYTVLAYQWESSILKYRISSDYDQKTGPPVWEWQDMIHIKADGNASEGIGKNDEYVRLLGRKYDEYRATLDSSSPLTSAVWETARNHYLEIAKGMNLVSTGTETGEQGERVKTRLGYPLMRRIGWQTRNKPLFIGNTMLLPLYSDGFDHSLVAITEDFGATWQFSEPIVGAGNVQPALALAKDGSVTSYMRDNGPPPKRLMKSISPDKGRTWGTVHDSEIPNPGTAADITVLRSGNWALVHNDIEQGRHQLSVWLSEDEGRTWPFRKVIVNGEPGSMTRGHYPAIIQGTDGTIHLTYTNQVASSDGKSEVKNIAHAFFTEKWLMQK